MQILTHLTFIRSFSTIFHYLHFELNLNLSKIILNKLSIMILCHINAYLVNVSYYSINQEALVNILHVRGFF